LLAHLARALRGDRVLLLGTYRDVEVGRQHPLESTLTSLTRDRVVELLTLRGLPPVGTAELIRARFGVEEVSAELRDLVHERTEGNPFFTEEVLSALVEQGTIFRAGEGWDRKAVTEIAVPQSIRSVVGQRVGRLPAEAQELLRLASVLGQEFELAVLLGAAEHAEAAVLAHLEAALGMKLLEERRVGRGERYGFAHALIGQTLYEEVPRFRLRRLHLRVGEALERAGGERPEVWAELARHFLAAGDEARATRYALLAGENAAGLYAHVEAVQHYEATLELLEEARDDDGAARVREKLGVQLRQMGRYEAALAALERAEARWRAKEDLEQLGQVLAEVGKLYYFGGSLYRVIGAPQEGVHRLQAVLPLLDARGPSAALAALHESLAYLFNRSGRYRDYLAAAERVADLARDLHDGRMVARAKAHRAEALQMLGRVAEALHVAEEAIPLLQAAGDLEGMVGVVALMYYIHVFRGEFDHAERAFQQAMGIAERLGDPFWIAGITSQQRGWRFLMGEWDQARKNVEQTLEMVGQSHSFFGFDEYDFRAVFDVLGRMYLAEGQWEEASRHLEAAAVRAARIGDMQSLRGAAGVLAKLAVRQGRPDVAMARLAPLLDRPGLEEFDVTYFLPVLAWAYLELGDLAQAEHIIEQALRRVRAEQLRLMLVDVLRVQGLILVRREQWDQAANALEEGTALARAMPYPYAEARLLQVHGQLHAEQGEPEQAQERLEAALAIFRRLGARKDVERTEQVLATLA
jgi:tetratricopeptide (TPR) repeat protein